MTNFLIEHSLAIILVLAGLISLFWLLQFQNVLKARWYAILIMAALVPILGILCGIALGAFENVLCGISGFNMTIVGTIFFMPLICLFGAKIFKRDSRMICDIFSICIICGAFFARTNCLISGCCLGKFIGNTGMRWPTREAELVFYAVMAIYIAIKLSKRKYDGTCYPLFMMAYGVVRFITELLRESEYILFGVIDIYLIWSVICFFIGAWLYFKLKKQAIISQKSSRKAKSK